MYNCDLCKNSNTDLCKDCRSPHWGSCYYEYDELKEEKYNINTTKDKLYEFNYEFQGQTYEIRDKGQWNKFMKSHGINDDIKQTPRRPEELKRQEYKPIPARELADDMLRTAQKLGIQRKIGQEIRQKIGRR